MKRSYKKRIWYQNTPEIRNTTIQNDSIYDIKCFVPGVFKGISIENEKCTLKQKIVRLYFVLITKGKLKIYYVEDQGKIIHTSNLMPKCFKFPFMKKGEYEIGPCYTMKEYRGRGIYPTVLKYIISDNGEATFDMMVSDKNNSSIRGVEKAGFVPVGHLTVSLLKRYKEYKM